MAALKITTKLDFIHRQKIRPQTLGHGLDRADPVFGARRHLTFFARQQRHNRRATQTDNPLVNLARQKPQRQTDYARFIAQHPFNRIMGFAGVGRPQNSRDSAVILHNTARRLQRHTLKPGYSTQNLLIMRHKFQNLAVRFKCFFGLLHRFLQHAQTRHRPEMTRA